MTIKPQFRHQTTTVEFCRANPRVLNFSDPGTGKTRAHIDAVAARTNRKRVLVLAPLTILKSAWGEDIAQYQPTMRYSLATAKNRYDLSGESDFVIANHDGIKAIAKHATRDPGILNEFDTIIIDEATAFKNLAGKGGSERARALSSIRHRFDNRHILTGTPGATAITDIWALAFLADDGQRLGTSFYAFRNQVTTPVQVGPTVHMIRWEERPGAVDIVYKQLEDITIRFRKRDCIDIPPNNMFTVYTELNNRLYEIYENMRRESVAELEEGRIVSAIHAGARAQKLLQICTGAVYDDDRNPTLLTTARYELVANLVAERPWPCIIAFNWRHERDQLFDALSRAGIDSIASIDGNTPPNERPEIVTRMQNGEIRALLLHPQSAAHGLTLTRARTTIWGSPTSNPEWFLQLNARADRAGQEHETETILISARNTREDAVYDLLNGRLERVNTLLELFA